MHFNYVHAFKMIYINAYYQIVLYMYRTMGVKKGISLC